MSSRKNLKSVSLYLFLGLAFIFVGFLVFDLNKSVVQIISSPSPISTPDGQIMYAKVTRVIDGDTIVIDSGAHIRYIGMNAPELSPLECYATEAADINKELVLGKTVKLEKDVSETDKYGRLLRFVYVDDPSAGSEQVFVDDYLVKVGAAKIMTVPPDVEFKDEFISSQNYAEQNKLGMWGKCDK